MKKKEDMLFLKRDNLLGVYLLLIYLENGKNSRNTVFVDKRLKKDKRA